MSEGSVEVDGGSVPVSNTPVQDQNDQGSDEGKGVVEDQNENDQGQDENQDQEQDQDEQGDKPKFTERGTKVDPNPQSAVHQELANLKRTLSEYQQVLENPKYLAAYAKQMGLTVAEAKEEIKDRQEEIVDEITPEKLRTAGDVAKALNDIKKEFGKNSKQYQQKIAELEGKITSLTEGRKQEKLANTIVSEVTSIREKWTELDPMMKDGKPTNPNYNPDLEQAIGKLYHKLDYDEQTKSYLGKVSIAEVAESIMTTAGIAKKQGSQDAQTVIKERREGRIITGNKQQESNKGSTIASRIAKAMGK